MDLDVDLPAFRQGLSNTQQLLARGWTSDTITAQLREKEIFRRRRAVYSRTPEAPTRAEYLLTDGTLDPAYLEQTREVMLGISRNACVAGRTLALLYGWDLLVEPTNVEVALPAGSWFRRPGVTVTQLEEREIVQHRNLGFAPLACLSRVDAVLHCALFLPMREAVAVADSAMRSKSVTLRQLKDGLRTRRGKRGYRRMRKVIDWSDPRCGSVLESAFRVLMLESGILRPESQVRLKGVGRVDFLWRDHRLVVEVDGRRWHDPNDARNTDRRRENSLTLGSWQLLRFSWAEIVHDPEYVVRCVLAALKGWMSAA
jgi:very-short-patch-repair endonuclease